MMTDLTPQERLFVKAYVVNFDRKAAVREAGYKTRTPGQTAATLLKRERIQRAIEDEIERKQRSFSIKESDILEGLYKEATYVGKGSSHSARIQAWNSMAALLGIGENNKKTADSALGEGKIVLVSYNNDGSSGRGDIKEITQEEKEEIESSVTTPSGVKVNSYASS